MNREDRDRIALQRAKKIAFDRIAQATLLELEIDELAKAEENAISRVDQEFARKINSPKRKTAAAKLIARTELAKRAIKLKMAKRVEKLKSRYGVNSV